MPGTRGLDLCVLAFTRRDCCYKERFFSVLTLRLLFQVQSSGMPILVYANKGDLPGSLSPQQCADELGLTGLNEEQTPWHIE